MLLPCLVDLLQMSYAKSIVVFLLFFSVFRYPIYVATFIGLSSGCLSTWPANLGLCVFAISIKDCIPDLSINSLLVI